MVSIQTRVGHDDGVGANSGGSVFDSNGFKPTRITDPRGAVTTLTYDKMSAPRRRRTRNTMQQAGPRA